MANLLLKNSGYYFRKVLPKDVQKTLNRRETQVALKTHSKREANDKAAYLSLAINNAVYHLRLNTEPTDMESLRINFQRRLDAGIDTIRQVDAEPKVPHLHTQTTTNNPTATTNKAEDHTFGKLKTLSVFFQEYKDHKIKSGEWGRGSLKESTNAFKLALEILGDKPIDTYTRENARHYRDTLLKLPSSRSKRKPYKDKTVKELISMTIPEEHKLKSKTVNAQLIWVSSAFKWALNEYQEAMTLNVFDGLSIKENDSVSYAPYSDIELKLLFNSDVYTKPELRTNKLFKYWLPLLGVNRHSILTHLCI